MQKLYLINKTTTEKLTAIELCLFMMRDIIFVKMLKQHLGYLQ